MRLARIPERSYDLLTKIIWAVPKRSEGELQDIVGDDFMRLSEGNLSEFQGIRERRRAERYPQNSPPLIKKTTYIGL